MTMPKRSYLLQFAAYSVIFLTAQLLLRTVSCSPTSIEDVESAEVDEQEPQSPWDSLPDEFKLSDHLPPSDLTPESVLKDILPPSFSPRESHPSEIPNISDQLPDEFNPSQTMPELVLGRKTRSDVADTKDQRPVLDSNFPNNQDTLMARLKRFTEINSEKPSVSGFVKRYFGVNEAVPSKVVENLPQTLPNYGPIISGRGASNWTPIGVSVTGNGAPNLSTITSQSASQLNVTNQESAVKNQSTVEQQSPREGRSKAYSYTYDNGDEYYYHYMDNYFRRDAAVKNDNGGGGGGAAARDPYSSSASAKEPSQSYGPPYEMGDPSEYGPPGHYPPSATYAMPPAQMVLADGDYKTGFVLKPLYSLIHHHRPPPYLGFGHKVSGLFGYRKVALKIILIAKVILLKIILLGFVGFIIYNSFPNPLTGMTQTLRTRGDDDATVVADGGGARSTHGGKYDLYPVARLAEQVLNGIDRFAEKFSISV